MSAVHDDLLARLRERFLAHPERHPGLDWSFVEARLLAHPDQLAVVERMEDTGGDPDVIGVDPKTGTMLFCDCAPETPSGRRSLCYDRAALDARKANKPSGSAMELAEAIGIELLDEEQYRHLQTLVRVDLRTSSWLATPPGVRKLGGALFGDRRYDRVFVYHNGADSYYAVRGFRGLVRI